MIYSRRDEELDPQQIEEPNLCRTECLIKKRNWIGTSWKPENGTWTYTGSQTRTRGEQFAIEYRALDSYKVHLNKEHLI